MLFFTVVEIVGFSVSIVPFLLPQNVLIFSYVFTFLLGNPASQKKAHVWSKIIPLSLPQEQVQEPRAKPTRPQQLFHMCHIIQFGHLRHEERLLSSSGKEVSSMLWCKNWRPRAAIRPFCSQLEDAVHLGRVQKAQQRNGDRVWISQFYLLFYL